jgi:transposase
MERVPMKPLAKTRRMYWVVWLGWFLAVWLLGWSYGLPVTSGNTWGGQVALPIVGSVVTHDPTQGALFPWLRPGRGRKWAWLHYQAACRAYARLRWAARRAYVRAVWAAGVARVLLTGALSLATVVDALTRAQLRRQLGAVPVLYALLEILQVREIVNRYCPSEAPVDQGTVATVLVLNRLMAPRPLVHVADWVAQTVLTQTLGGSAAKFNDDRLGRLLDALATHQRAIWLEIVNVALVQFEIDLHFIFYDLTALVMQGEYPDSDLVDYGFAHNTPSNKQKVKEALSVSSDGHVPLEADVLSGRTADLATVQANLERLCHLLHRAGYPVDQVLIIGDRGTLNDEIALTYEAKGLKYLAGLKASQKAHVELLKAVPEEQFARQPLTTERGHYGHYGRSCSVTFQHAGKTVTHHGLVLLSGPMRHAVRHERAQQLSALRTELAAVRARIGQKRCRSVQTVQARANTCLRRSPVGHLLRAEAAETAEHPLDLRWWVDTDALWHAMQTDGRYLLVTNDGSLTPQRMFEVYRAKDGVEKCFRISKQVLQVRPLYVHSDERIEALLLINLLALLVYSLLERELRQHGLPWTTQRLIGQLENLTVIETQCWDGSVVCRLTPVTAEQRQLMTFLDRLMADRRLQRLRAMLTKPVDSLILPERSTPPPRLAVPPVIA